MEKNLSWKFTDESSATFQSSVSGPGEFGPSLSPHLQWIVRNFLADRGSCSAGCSALHRMVVPSSDFETGRTNREIDVHVLTVFPEGLEFSWVCPERISRSSMYHLRVGGGFPPVAMHSISKSSPAEAVMWSAASLSPTLWITILLGFSEKKKKDCKIYQ